ncbi:MAG: hypothetical protein DMG90_21390 [Acidobacteria bacterium]|nr:MAG: hypothetical protein DMG90_21390 [Acidobacteriota bacterium]
MLENRAAGGRRVVNCLVVGIASVLLACGTISAVWSQAAAQAPAATVESGRKGFEQSCGFCHGADATGARGPDLVRSSLVAHDVKGDLIGQVIRNGRPDKGMPGRRSSRGNRGVLARSRHGSAGVLEHSEGVPGREAAHWQRPGRENFL